MGKGSSWQTETGLLDDFDFEVKDAWFGEDDESETPDGRIFLFLRGDAVDDEGEEHEDHVERYSTGKNWEVVEDGEEVEKATGKNSFNKNAGLGRLIDAFVSLGDDEADYLAGRGEANEASTFAGLKMHMEGRVVSKWKNDDGEDVEWMLNLPTDLTMKKAKSKSKAKAKKGGGKSGKASRTKAKKSSKDDGLRSAISDFAGQFGENEHDEFVDQILDDDVFDRAQDIFDDDELHAEVLDPDSDLWSDSH